MPKFNPNFCESDKPDLEIEIMGTKFANPLVVASGTLVETFDEIEPYFEAGAGAVVPRSTRKVLQRTVHPSPHLYQEGKGRDATMLNGEWTGAALDYWRPHLESMAELSGPVIMSVSGRDIEGCVDVCKELDQYGFPYLEVNISCGVSNGVHGYITRNQEHIKKLCDEIKDAGIKTPIALKLGHSDVIVDLASVAEEHGADGIVAINTYGPVLDFRIGSNGRPERVIGAIGAKGGLSGDAIFHTALTDVANISMEVSIPVIASGGVMDAERATKMIMAGASQVQLYTVLHDNGKNAPRAMGKFLNRFEDYLTRHGISSVSEIKGAAISLMEEETELEPQIPVVDKLGCIGCNACVVICLPDAFDIVPSSRNKVGHVVEINDNCVGCGHCVTKCPVPGVLTLPFKEEIDW